MNHDIFRTPNQVDPTLTEQPTPSSYAHYPDGRDLGETMPMWRVQTEGYLAGDGQLIGVVSRDMGFLDSPDTEWISGGVNSKGPNAVALGRHGNFFHWGFAASPTFLTDEAKDVFVNALYYISRYAGRTPIARKQPGTMLRGALDDAIERLSIAGHARTIARYEQLQRDDAKRKAEIQARIDAGEEVSELDRNILSSRAPRIPARSAAAKRLVPPEVMTELGDDPDALAVYLRENRPYLRPTGWYQLVVDEELKALRIANDDAALLDRLVAMRATDGFSEVAQRLLERYTDQSFDTAEGWRRWLEESRSQLFFTEAGGFKWLVDPAQSTPTLPQTKQPADEEAVEEAPTALVDVQATKRSPLASGLGVKPLAGDRYAVTVVVDILSGWHAYDSVPANSPYTPLTIELELPEGASIVGDWDRPAALASFENPGLTTFEGRLEFRCEVESSSSSIACKVGYQVCDEHSCMPPTTVRHAATSAASR